LLEIPDVLGIELEKAKTLLNSEGLDFIVKETKPTRREPIEGTLRVIKIITNSEELVLTVCKI